VTSVRQVCVTAVDDILRESCELFVRLMRGLLALRLKPDWKAVELEPTGATQMELDDIEVGAKCRCDYKGAQYFATVVSKDDMGEQPIVGGQPVGARARPSLAAIFTS
jgi:hypothetical protein